MLSSKDLLGTEQVKGETSLDILCKLVDTRVKEITGDKEVAINIINFLAANFDQTKVFNTFSVITMGKHTKLLNRTDGNPTIVRLENDNDAVTGYLLFQLNDTRVNTTIIAKNINHSVEIITLPNLQQGQHKVAALGEILENPNFANLYYQNPNYDQQHPESNQGFKSLSVPMNKNNDSIMDSLLQALGQDEEVTDSLSFDSLDELRKNAQEEHDYGMNVDPDDVEPSNLTLGDVLGMDKTYRKANDIQDNLDDMKDKLAKMDKELGEDNSTESDKPSEEADADETGNFLISLDDVQAVDNIWSTAKRLGANSKCTIEINTLHKGYKLNEDDVLDLLSKTTGIPAGDLLITDMYNWDPDTEFIDPNSAIYQAKIVASPQPAKNNGEAWVPTIFFDDNTEDMLKEVLVNGHKFYTEYNYNFRTDSAREEDFDGELWDKIAATLGYASADNMDGDIRSVGVVKNAGKAANGQFKWVGRIDTNPGDLDERIYISDEGISELYKANEFYEKKGKILPKTVEALAKVVKIETNPFNQESLTHKAITLTEIENYIMDLEPSITKTFLDELHLAWDEVNKQPAKSPEETIKDLEFSIDDGMITFIQECYDNIKGKLNEDVNVPINFVIGKDKLDQGILKNLFAALTAIPTADVVKIEVTKQEETVSLNKVVCKGMIVLHKHVA